MSDKRKLYWDTTCFIAYISGSHPDEAHRTPICIDVLENARRGEVELWTSVLTIVEVIRRKLPAKEKPLPSWADVIAEKCPAALPYVRELWEFHDRKTAPTKPLIKSEIDGLQQLFNEKYIHKIQVDEIIAKRAVALAQEYGFRAPDAIHAASAILKPCDCIQRFDKDYDKIAGLIKIEEPARISEQGSLSLSAAPPEAEGAE
jgi:predicted nucleic acid-binding protein